MCFAPYPRPLLVRHGGVFSILTPNTCCATAACTFSTSQLPKVVRTCSVFSILTSKSASRHRHVHFWSDTGGVCSILAPHVLRATTALQFFHLSSPKWLRTRRFSGTLAKPTFWLSGSPNIGKFARVHLLSTAFLFSDLFSSSSLFSDSSHLCFSICPYCRKFDFQTPFDQNLQLFKDHRWHPHLKTDCSYQLCTNRPCKRDSNNPPIDRKKTAIPRGL